MFGVKMNVKFLIKKVVQYCMTEGKYVVLRGHIIFILRLSLKRCSLLKQKISLALVFPLFGIMHPKKRGFV